MTTKTKAKKQSGKSSNYDQLMQTTGRKPKVQNFAQFAADSDHKRLDEMIDQTIYIVKMEPQQSDNFGSGFKLWFKDLPNARQTYTAACYGQYIVPALDNMYRLTHDGKQINPDNPVKVTIRKAGRSYRFE